MNFLLRKVFFAEIKLYEKKWLINCFCHPHKSEIGKHLDIIRMSSDTYSTKHENIVVLGDFNACVEGKTLGKFVNLIPLIVLLNNLHALKIPRILVALI